MTRDVGHRITLFHARRESAWEATRERREELERNGAEWKQAGYLAIDELYKRLSKALCEIADMPEPLNNKNSALNQCAYLKGLAEEALGG